MFKKISKIIKKYLPDIILLIGVWIFSFNILRPKKYGINTIWSNDYTDYKVFGIILIFIGIDILVRRYLSTKNTH